MENNWKPEVCFYHVEKCGGTSLRRTLQAYFAALGKSVEAEQNLITVDDRAILEVKQPHVLLSHCSFDMRKISDDFADTAVSITCLREPRSRFLSHYYYFLQPETKCPFFELPLEKRAQLARDFGKTMLLRVSGETMNMEMAKHNLRDRIQFVLFVETLADDLVALEQQLNRRFNHPTGSLPMRQDNQARVSYARWHAQDMDALAPVADLMEDMELYRFAREELTLAERGLA